MDTTFSLTLELRQAAQTGGLRRSRARERLVKKNGLKLQQSYERVGKLMLIKQQRYAHAHQFGRANKALKKLKTYLGRVMCDIGRKIAGKPALESAFA